MLSRSLLSSSILAGSACGQFAKPPERWVYRGRCMKTQSVTRISLRSAEKASLSLDAESEFEDGFRHETLLFRDEGGVLELQFVKPIIAVRRHARARGHPEAFDVPEFRLSLAIASELVNGFREHHTSRLLKRVRNASTSSA